MEQLPESLPDYVASKFRNDLGRLNDYSFRDRLRATLSKRTWAFKWLSGVLRQENVGSDQLDEYCGKLVKIRNELTHVESLKRRKSSKPRGGEFHLLAYQAKMLLALLVLDDLGVVPEEKLIKESAYYQSWW